MCILWGKQNQPKMVKTSQKSDTFLHHQRQSIDDALGLLKLVPLDGFIHCKLLDFGPEVPSGKKWRARSQLRVFMQKLDPRHTIWRRCGTD